MPQATRIYEDWLFLAAAGQPYSPKRDPGFDPRFHLYHVIVHQPSSPQSQIVFLLDDRNNIPLYLGCKIELLLFFRLLAIATTTAGFLHFKMYFLCEYFNSLRTTCRESEREEGGLTSQTHRQRGCCCWFLSTGYKEYKHSSALSNLQAQYKWQEEKANNKGLISD